MPFEDASVFRHVERAQQNVTWVLRTGVTFGAAVSADINENCKSQYGILPREINIRE